MRTPSITGILTLILIALGMSHPVLASDYPTRPVTLHTMVQSGAQIDLLTRRYANLLGNELGQPVLVVNSPGGSHGSVKAMAIKNARPDGYTLGLGATAAYTYSPHFVRTGYSFDDFEYVALLGLNQSGFVAAPDRPWNTLREALEWAKKENRALTYMFQGSDDRDAMQRIAAQEGVRLSLMPSTGGPSIISAVMGGHADLGHLGAILFDYVKSGRLKLLASSNPERLTALPDVPTLREQGWDETVEMYLAVTAPKDTPEAILQRLEQANLNIEKNEEFIAHMSDTLLMRPSPSLSRTHVMEYMKEANQRFKQQAAAPD